MANLAKIIDDIATSAKLEKFLSSLNHADLPAGWQNDQGIVDAAGKLYREMGTDSPFFKAWFGDSKAVDAGGNPITAYHGTNKDFDTFSKDKISPFGQYGGNKFFFTGDENVARGYGDNTINAFLKAEYGLPEKRAARQAGEALKEINYIHPANDPRDIWAVSEPTQIKSTANRGTFDPNDPNILRTAAPWLAGGGLAAGSVLGADDAQAAPRAHADANNLDRTIERLSKSLPLNDMASGMIPRATQASVQPINNMGVWQQMERQGRVTPDLPVPEAEWSPVDLATAPIGAAGKVGKLAAMALDAPANLAMNRLIDALSAGANTASNWWNGK